MSDKLNKVKEIIKKNIEDAKCGIFFTRNIVGDPTQILYVDTDNIIEVDICYKYEYFEIFGLNEKEQKEIKNYYEIIKDYDKFDEFGFFNPFAFDEEEEELDFVQPHKKVSVNLKVCTEEQAEQEPKTGHWYIDERPESNREIICSNCEQPVFKYHKLDFDYRPKYCPNCGAKMK